MSQKIYNILDHICDDHLNCDSAWCYNKKTEEAGKVYSTPKERRLNKEADTQTYQQLKKIFDQYACVQQMEYCNHPFDKQTNESLNQVIATVSPKSVCYSSTGSLNSWIAIVIGIHNLGYEAFFNKVFQKLGTSRTTTLTLTKHLRRKDDRRECKKNYDRKFSVKQRRSQKQKENGEETFKERTDKSYGAGFGLTAGIQNKQKVGNASQLENISKQKRAVCKCGRSEHQRTTHQSCPLNPKNEANNQ